MELRVIKLGINHLKDCIELDQKCLKGLWTNSQWEREIIDPKRICLGIIQMNSSKLLALCSGWLVVDELQISMIAVHPLYRRRGLGRFILSELISPNENNF